MAHNQDLSSTQPTERINPPEHIAYSSPAVIYEANLEVSAGSPLGIPDPLDLFGKE